MGGEEKLDSLLEYRNCPNCGKNDFSVLFESNIKERDFQEGIKTVYMYGGKYGRHVRCLPLSSCICQSR